MVMSFTHEVAFRFSTFPFGKAPLGSTMRTCSLPDGHFLCCSTLADRTSHALNAADIAGTRWGLSSLTMEARVACDRLDERFTPASTQDVHRGGGFHRSAT
jgi:hypothetical protein